MKSSKCKWFRKIMLTGFAAAALILSGTSVNAEAANANIKTYDVIFRAGSQGTIGGAKTMTLHDVAHGRVLNQADEDIAEIIAQINVKEGYLFTGFECHGKNLNEVTVAKKTTLVAKYKRAVDAMEYKINYVDTDGNQIATSSAGIANKDDIIQAYPRQVEGYTATTGMQEVLLTENGQEINLVYLENGVETVYETETVTQTIPGTAAPGGAAAVGAGGGAAAAAAPEAAEEQPAEEAAGGEVAELPDEEVPLGDQELTEEGELVQSEDEEVPRGNQELKEDQENSKELPIAIGALAVVIVIGAITAIIKKRKG